MIPKQLSIVERQILANQFEILSKLCGEDEYSARDFEKKSEIVKYGYTGEYSEVFDVHIDEIPHEICRETNEILNMYRRIETAKAKLIDDEKRQLDLNKIKFEGFDANNNSHYHYAKYMIENLDKWQEHKEMYLNSHSEFPLMKYRKMLAIQEKAFSENRYELNLEDLKEMIASI